MSAHSPNRNAAGFINHSQIKSAVNAAPIMNVRPKCIQNRVYRQCAKDGFTARLRAELAGDAPATVPLYSHHTTRQSYFEQGWQAVTQRHLMRAKARALVAKEC